MGFFDSIGDALSSSNFLSSAFSTIASTGLGLLQSDMEQDSLDMQRQDAKDKLLLDLKLKQLEALYGSKGGGGGGGGAGRLTTAQKLSAVQNQADTKIDAINNLINATQRGILGGR